MKKYTGRDMQYKITGSYKLIGYIFWIDATWFLCGETSKLHLKAFEGSLIPSPIEIMVFLVLGWLFVLIGDYKEMQLKRDRSTTRPASLHRLAGIQGGTILPAMLTNYKY
jgi:hypothetical protein